MENVVLLAFLAGIFTWALTALGASSVFFTKKHSERLLDGMLGFAAGIMISASFFSLLMPAIEHSSGWMYAWFPPLTGFLAGGLFLKALDSIIPHIHLRMKEAEGIKTSLSRLNLFILAVTLHNIPEGMAIGVSFGTESIASSMALAVGIGIQNIPEGFAISMPLRAEGESIKKSFFIGQLSAVVEPVFAFVGALITTLFASILPFALSFAAGAMIYVVVEEVIPEAESHGNEDLATLMALSGFAVMMFLDLAFS